MKINIIIASFNEEKRAIKTINQVLKNTKSKVIVIDDGSKKHSQDLLKNNFQKSKQIQLIFHATNQGKGRAMKTGIDKAFQNNADAVIFIDADGQHNPSLLHLFEQSIKKNNLVFGYRVLDKNVPLIRKWGNYIIKKLATILFDIKRQDLLCGFFAMRLDSYKQLEWSSDRYGVETEIAAKIGKQKLKFSEIKINTTYLSEKKGMTIFDAIKVMLKIPKWYFMD